MKLCFIASAGSIHTQRWVQYFTQKGHEVHLISPTASGCYDTSAIKLYILKNISLPIRQVSYILNLLFYIIQIKQIIHRIKPDILHAHYVTDCGFWGALCNHHPFILSAWGSDILVEPHTSKIARYCTRFALKRADLILVAGERLIAPAINLGANTDKISLLPVGVDTKEFTLRETSSGTKETPARITTVISTRNLNPIYNLETLVRAIPLVLKQVPQTNFIIIGDGVQKIYLQDLAKSLGVIDKVEFTGHLPHNQLPGYLASADVYVSTSLSDGSSVSMLEAMSCGPAPIVTDVGDVRNWITDGINGFIIPTKRPDLLATHIIQLLKDNEFRKKIKTLNRRIVEARADYQNNMSKMEKTYEQLVEAFNNK